MVEALKRIPLLRGDVLPKSAVTETVVNDSDEGEKYLSAN
jgi:hypothetical protein